MSKYREDKNVNYKPDIALGHILTMLTGLFSLIAAYFFFVAKTEATFASHEEQIKQNSRAILEIKKTLVTIPTKAQLEYIESDVKEMKDDISWLVRREAEKDKR